MDVRPQKSVFSHVSGLCSLTLSTITVCLCQIILVFLTLPADCSLAHLPEQLLVGLRQEMKDTRLVLREHHFDWVEYEGAGGFRGLLLHVYQEAVGQIVHELGWWGVVLLAGSAAHGCKVNTLAIGLLLPNL